MRQFIRLENEKKSCVKFVKLILLRYLPECISNNRTITLIILSDIRKRKNKMKNKTVLILNKKGKKDSEKQYKAFVNNNLIAGR